MSDNCTDKRDFMSESERNRNDRCVSLLTLLGRHARKANDKGSEFLQVSNIRGVDVAAFVLAPCKPVPRDVPKNLRIRVSLPITAESELHDSPGIAWLECSKTPEAFIEDTGERIMYEVTPESFEGADSPRAVVKEEDESDSLDSIFGVDIVASFSDETPNEIDIKVIRERIAEFQLPRADYWFNIIAKHMELTRFTDIY